MTTAAASQRNFGAAAADYATNSYHANGPDLRALVEAARLTGGERVLDAGTGAGHTALAVAPRAASVVGIDVTAEMLEAARDLARRRAITNVSFQEADASCLPFPDASFDLVTNRQSAHHYADLEAAVRETRRVLRPGGTFVLVDSVCPGDAALDTFLNTVELLRDSSHVRDRRLEEWLILLSGAGFDAEVLDRYPIPLDGADWVRRMRTPPSKVAVIRELFRDAPKAARRVFDIRDEPWGFSIPGALIRAIAR
jgi:SAM-dependent methyltransferase